MARSSRKESKEKVDGAVLSVILFSGGLDSCVLAHELVAGGARLRALYVDVGKSTCENEIAAVKRLTLDLNIPLEVVRLPGMVEIQRGYAPYSAISQDELDVGGNSAVLNTSGFYVLLAVAAFHAQLIGAQKLYVGVIRDQLKSRPGLVDFFSSMAGTVNLLNPQCATIDMCAPYLKLAKADIVAKGAKLGTDFSIPWSCLSGGPMHCGKCLQCVERKLAFKEAKLKDPTKYLK